MSEDACAAIEPAELIEQSLTDLDWSELLELLARACASEPGRRALRGLEPLRRRAEAEQRMRAVASALELTLAGAELPQAGFPELGELLDRIGRGAAASGNELHDLLRVLVQARRLRAHVREHGRAHAALAAMLTSDVALDHVAERLDSCLEAGGRVSDGASATLSEARARAAETELELRQLLKRLVKRHAAVLSGDYFAEREGRYVLPVRADAHERIEGSVVGSSASGNTLFVEPHQVVELVNRLRVRQAAVEREVTRVLAELSALALSRLDQARRAFLACVEGDVLAALVRWSLDTGSRALPPEAEPRLDLRLARHPLLARSASVVPNDLTLAAGRAMVVSGPNAGGKTVALKTLGLFALMVRAGIPVPCEAGSYVGFFDSVLCDVGDQQSLVQSLSTFSGHVRKLASIIEAAGRGTLVLLDEVAAGTDPEEGAALAGAVLQVLVERGAAVAVTTHYERLKELATHPGPLVNACVGFDYAELSPTFHVTLGAFGPSSALLVASRFGLSKTVIERARTLMPAEALERERVTEELERERKRLADVRRDLDQERERLERERQELLDEERRDAERVTHELRLESERLLGDVHRARAEIEEARRRLKAEARDSRLVREVERGVSRVAAEVALGGALSPANLPGQPGRNHEGRPREPNESELGIGARVRVRSNGALGTVLEPASRGQVLLQVGAVRLRVPLADLMAVSAVASASRRSPRAELMSSSLGQHERARRTRDNTLDLRGTRVEDAENCLDAFIDRMLGEGEEVGFVLHGHGTGALKSAVRKHLERSEWVASAAPAHQDEGGDAFTMFRLASR